MNKEKLIEALEIALAELRKPTITFTPPKLEPLSEEDMTEIASNYFMFSGESIITLLRNVEKAHGIGE